MKFPEHLIAVIEILIGAYRVIVDMAKQLARFAANKFVQGIVLLVAFAVVQVAILLGVSSVPLSIGASLCLGLLGGAGVWGWRLLHEPPVEKHTETVEKLVPYDQWPDQCYVCNSDIDGDMKVRGQFVVHKGQSEAETKAAPLCEECTWTYTTLAEYDEQLVSDVYDCRGEPVDL